MISNKNKNITVFLLCLCCFLTLPVPLHSKARMLKREFYIREVQNNEDNSRYILPLCDSIATYSLQMSDTLTACTYLMKKANYHYLNYDYYNAFQAYEHVNQLISTILEPESDLQDIQQQALALTIKTAHYLGYYFYGSEKCYELLTDQHNDDLLLFAYSFLAIYMQNMNNHKDAQRSIETADRIVRRNPNINPVVLKNYWNNKAGIFFYHNQTDSAIYCQNKAIQYAEKQENGGLAQNNFNINLARTYWRIGEYNLAKHCFRKIYSRLKDVPLNQLHVNLMYDYSKLCYEMGQIDSAKIYYRQTIQQADSLHYQKAIAKANILYSNILYKEGNYKKSRDYYVKGTELLDSIREATTNETSMMIHNEFSNKTLERQHLLLVNDFKELQKCNHSKNILLGLLSVVIIIIATIYFSIRKKKLQAENSYLLKEQQNEIEKNSLEQQIAQQTKDLEIKGHQLQLLSQAITSFHIASNQVYDHLKSISETTDLSVIKETAKSAQQIIKNNKQEDIIITFENHFNQQMNEFSNRLLTICGSLTPNELQLSMLLAMDMPAKDIAFYLNKSVRTVESMVYRLRKKLEIPTQTKTTQFFQDFMKKKNESLPAPSETPSEESRASN